MAKLTGGGILGNKNVNVGVRTGSPNKATSPAAASQLGQSTAFKKEQCDTGRAYDGAKLGNAKALDVGKGSPGADRTIHKSGSQNQWGPPNQGETRGEPRGFDTRGRGKGEV
jgi:hypothetical protein